MSANEFRMLMIDMIKLSLSDIEPEDDFLDGYGAGLREAVRKLECAAFLTAREE